jgi:hypothetical protein
MTSPVPHKDFSDSYDKMSGKGESASEAHDVGPPKQSTADRIVLVALCEHHLHILVRQREVYTHTHTHTHTQREREREREERDTCTVS